LFKLQTLEEILELAILIYKFQVVELVFTMAALINGMPQPMVGVIVTVELLPPQRAVLFPPNFKLAAISDLAHFSKLQIIQQ